MAIALLLAILLVILACGYLFVAHPVWFPAGVSAHAAGVDHQFAVAFWLLGVLFVAGHIALGFSLMHARRRGKASYLQGDWRLEALWTILIAVLFFGFNVASVRLWSQMKFQQPDNDAVQVEVTGTQFEWYFRYAGVDGKLGRTDAQRFARPEEGNPLGIDPDDPAGKDDLVSTSLVLPVSRDVDLTLRSNDVIHSLFIPAMRFKQDAVPGMIIHTHFRPMQTGEYEISCAELCGLGHYRMHAVVKVVNEAEFKQWLKSKELAAR